MAEPEPPPKKSGRVVQSIVDTWPFWRAEYSDGTSDVFRANPLRRLARVSAYKRKPTGTKLVSLHLADSALLAEATALAVKSDLETWKPKDLKPIEERDKYEQAILYLLCTRGRYHSSVTLAADLFETSVEAQESRVLEWNLVELILADLNDQGLVTYRLNPGLFDLFIHIKATILGYQRAKVEFKWMHQVGAQSRIRDQPLRGRNDRTDFRTHGWEAQGVGATITEDFIEHCVECDHIVKHRPQLLELYGTDKI